MPSKTAKELRLIKSILSFDDARKKDGVCLLNGEIPKHQRRLLDSIISQATSIKESGNERH